MTEKGFLVELKVSTVVEDMRRSSDQLFAEICNE